MKPQAPTPERIHRLKGKFEVATGNFKRKATYALGMVVVFIMGGVVGRVTDTPAPGALQLEIPPPSLRVVSKQLLKRYCMQNKAFSEFQNPDEHNVRRQVDVLRVEAVPLSESGIICELEGEMLESTRESGFGTVVRSRFTKAFIVTGGGQAQFVSKEFASALSKAELEYQAFKSQASQPGHTAQ